MATEYTARRIKEMDAVALFVTLGLHRGQVGDYTFVRNPGTSREAEHSFTYYFLGFEDFIGVDDTFSRRVFHRSQNFAGKHFLEQCAGMRADSPWQGPAESPRWSMQLANKMREDANFALKVLRGEISTKPSFNKKKPAFKIKPKVIAHEDRPDIGAAVTKPRFTLKPKQGDLFEQPKRRFTLKRR